MKREKRNGRKGGKRFEDKGGTGVLHWQRGHDEPDWTVEVYKLEESKEEDSVGGCGTSKRNRNVAGRTVPGLRATKSFESRKGK